MNRVRIIAGEFADREAAVVQDQRECVTGRDVPRDRLYVLIDGTDNPVPYKASELEERNDA